MDDNQDSSTTEAATTGEQATSDAGSANPGYVTPDQLQDFRNGLMGDIRKTMAGMIKSQAPAPAPQAKPAAKTAQPAAEAVDVPALLRHERITSSAIAKAGLNDAQGEMVRQLMDAQNPEDPGAFVSNFAQTIGAAVPGTSATQTQNQTATPNPNPASDGGTPGMTPSLESDDVPIWKWSEEKIQRVVREKGMRGFADMAKQRLQKDLHGVRFSLPKG